MPNRKRNQMPLKVLVAMSGGVDSAMAAWFLKERGYEPLGLSFRIWRLKPDPQQELALTRAGAVCEKLAIPHLIEDLQAEFEAVVVRKFIDEYLAGWTPNPCVFCNRVVKWSNLLRVADAQAIAQVATGHYARLRQAPDRRWQILKACDESKDQSYALWQLPQDALARTIFPMGDKRKADIKRLAQEIGLLTEEVRESQDVCFIPENDYRRFLRDYAPDAISHIGEGELVDESGKVVGRHHGFFNFTIGQRRGFGIGFKERMYVKALDAPQNRVVIAADSGLLFTGMIIGDINWVGKSPMEQFTGTVKIRYNHPGAPATLQALSGNQYRVVFEQAQRAICPGQSAVVYQDDALIMGGVIETALTE